MSVPSLEIEGYFIGGGYTQCKLLTINIYKPIFYH